MEATQKHDPSQLRTVPLASDKYVGELDGVRAIAVCIVVFAHYRLLPYMPGGFGVTLFFFLSGYLITTLFFSEFQGARQISVRQFYLRRWLRLTPSLLVLVVLGVVFYPISRTAVGGQPVPGMEIVAALFYFTNYYILAHGMDATAAIPLGICWSLAIEEHFYLVWPWVVRKAIAYPQRLFATIVAVCVAVLIWRLVLRYAVSVSTDYTYMATDCRIDSILYGALLRVMFETSWAAGAVRLLRSRACRFVGLTALLATFVVRDDDFRETFRYAVQGIALMPVFTAILSDDPKVLVRRMLRSAPLVLIGRLSYSIYLVHLLARTPGEVYFGSPYHPGAVISGLLITVALAGVLFVFIERPLARVRHRFRGEASKVAGRPMFTPAEEQTPHA
jgi:peptidoglycan/LPS O-acetylase OafA/YrhL